MSNETNGESPDEKATGYRGSSKTGWRSTNAAPGLHGCTGGTDEKPCNGFPILDTDRCYFHTHPQERNKIKQQKAARELVVVLEDSIFNNEQTYTTPLEGLQHEMYRTLAIIRWLGTRLDTMAREDPAGLAKLVTEQVEEVYKPKSPQNDRETTVATNVLRRQIGRSEPGMSPWLIWYLRERDHFVRVCGLIANLNVKMLRLEWPKNMGDRMIEAMQATFFELGMDPSDKRNVQAILKGLEFAAGEGVVTQNPTVPGESHEDLSGPPPHRPEPPRRNAWDA